MPSSRHRAARLGPVLTAASMAIGLAVAGWQVARVDGGWHLAVTLVLLALGMVACARLLDLLVSNVAATLEARRRHAVVGRRLDDLDERVAKLKSR